MNYFNLILSNKSILRIFQLEIFKKFKIDGDVIEFGASEEIEKNFCNKNLKNCKITYSNLDPSNKKFLNINLQKNFFLNTFRTIKFIIHKFFFSNHVEKTQFNHVLTFGELNKKKENKYLDFPSFWIKFNLKKRQKSLITYVDENFDYSNDIYLFRDKFKKKINDRSLYIRKLNYFFSQVEKKYRCKIIICCKKRFRYKKNYFDGRKIFKSKKK